MTTRSEFAAALTAIRQQADLSIRELARAVGIPPATVGGWFSGRNLPQPGHLSGLRHLLAVCGVPDADVPSWLDLVERVRATGAGAADRPSSPYPGLTSFGVDDAALFFGRRAETGRVLDRLDTAGHRMTAVVGPSGSGKTSLLRAGVTAELRAAGRAVAVMTPGSEPSASLAEAMLDGPEVLVVDQFEELFTSVADPDARRTFLRDLVAGPAAVVIGLRADFYSAAAAEPELLDVLRHGQLLLGPLTEAALRDAIVAPAGAVGVTVDAGLVDLVVADLTPRDALGRPHDAGALPLLSHALRAAWEGGDGTVFGVEDYRRTGGIDGAIQRSAEQALAAVGPERYDDVRRLFLRLVTIDDTDATATSTVAVTRRRVGGAEFDALLATSDDTPAGRDTTRAVDEFVERRLLTVGDGSLEISHEALVSAWPRLGDWIDEDRLGLVLHRQVTEAANAWLAADRDDTLLLRGSRLDAAAELAAQPTPRTALNAVESEFVAAGVTARDRARHRARRTTSRLRRLLAAVVVLLLAAGGLSVYALRARSAADDAEARATAARNDALSRQLAVESAQLADSDPALSQQIALAAFRTSGTTEARGAVIEASARPVVTRLLGRFGYTPLSLAPSKTLAAVGQADGAETRLLSLTSPVAKVVATMRRPYGGAITAVAFSNDSRRLYAVGTRGHLLTYDVTRSARPVLTADVSLGAFTPRALATVPGRRQLVIGGQPDGRARGCPVQRWDVTSRPRLMSVACLVPPDLRVQAVAVSADGNTFAAGGRASTVYLWGDTERRARRVDINANLVFSLLFAAKELLVGDSDGHVSLVDPASTRRRAQLGGKASAWVLSLAMSPDGTMIEAGGSDSVLRTYSLRTLKQTRTQSFPTQVTGVAVRRTSGSVDDVIATSGNGATYVLPSQGARFATPATTFNLGFDRSGSRLVAATDGDGGGVQVWDVRGDVPVPVTGLLRMTGGSRAVGTGAITASGQLAASGAADGSAQLFDLHHPHAARPAGPAFRMLGDVVESMAFDPTGRILAAGGDDATVALWDVRHPTRPRALARVRGSDTFYGVAWSDSGTLLAGANVDSHVYLWSTDDPLRPRLLAKLGGFDQEVWGVAISRDSRILAATGSDRTTRVWDIRDPRHPKQLGRPFTGPTDYVYSASFAPDGSLLAVSSNDGTVSVYDLRSSRRTPLVNLAGGGPNLFAVTFSPDGRQLVASGRGDDAVVWLTDPEVYADRLCARTGTPVTRAEWAQLVPGIEYTPPCRT